jgi:N-methylhydantoinase A
MRVAVDVGGTFTDAIALAGEQLRISKTLTTPGRVAEGFLAAVRALTPSTNVELLLHGTTIILNAILTRKYPRTALITTMGFRDVLEIMRADRKDLFDIRQRKPLPLVPRHLRFELNERIGADGLVITPAEETAIKQLVPRLREQRVEAVAVCLLFSFVNPTHELLVGRVLAEAMPDLPISLSHQILPVYREFERTSTTVVNALAQPLMREYVNDVIRELNGLAGRFFIMQSSGGVIDHREAAYRPSFTLFSGPAGGVVGASQLARLAGFENVISFDMGGTSCDVSAVTRREPDRVTQLEVSGYPVQIPSLDIVSVGAGGGSIAWIDPGGALHVGPQSAGAVPGPACYGRGGTEPTVTDAAVCLGWYNPASALGGELSINSDLAKRSMEKLARMLGLSLEEVTWGILRIVNANMANAVREVSVERGRDPREYTLVAMGGAGGAHAFDVASQLAIEAVLIPPFPGVASAYGMLLADIRRESVLTIHRPLDEMTAEEVATRWNSMGSEMISGIIASGVREADIALLHGADLRYRGQTYELTIHVPDLREFDPIELQRRFHEAHERRYGHAFPDAGLELVNLRTAGTGSFGLKQGINAVWMDFATSEREVYWGPRVGWKATQVLSRATAEGRGLVIGPAIIEQSDATIVVPPDWRARQLFRGCLLLSENGYS